MRRRSCLLAILGVGAVLTAQQKDASPDDWVCPMDPAVRLNKPGSCPRCGMVLVQKVPDRLEYPIEVRQSPTVLQPGDVATLVFRVLDPTTNQPVRRFELVHEKLIHVFLVSENLAFFAHVHPVLQEDGSFKLIQRLPLPGMYRLLADFYPSGSVPQLSLDTLFVSGRSQPPHLRPTLAPRKAENLTATLIIDPVECLAGLETKLFFTLDPPGGLELYLGAWAHMLVASEDLIDLMHLHPFIAAGGPTVQFNVIFPRPGIYRIWTQFQRQGKVNTVEFTVPVKAV